MTPPMARARNRVAREGADPVLDPVPVPLRPEREGGPRPRGSLVPGTRRHGERNRPVERHEEKEDRHEDHDPPRRWAVRVFPRVSVERRLRKRVFWKLHESTVDEEKKRCNTTGGGLHSATTGGELRLGTRPRQEPLQWKIFWGTLVLGIIVVVVTGVFALLANVAHGFASVILYIVAVILGLISVSIVTGGQATVYEKLVG